MACIPRFYSIPKIRVELDSGDLKWYNFAEAMKDFSHKIDPKIKKELTSLCLALYENDPTPTRTLKAQATLLSAFDATNVML